MGMQCLCGPTDGANDGGNVNAIQCRRCAAVVQHAIAAILLTAAF